MTKRNEYYLNRSDFEQREPPAGIGGIRLRGAEETDVDALSGLMIDAYRGTIDYDGETQENANVEVQAYLRGERGGRALLDESRLAFAGKQLVGACLVGMWRERGAPVVAYVMTAAGWKGRGVAGLALGSVLKTLYEAGYQEVRAMITDGNVPSERLFAGYGFRRVNIS